MVELIVFILATVEIVFGRKTAEAIGGALFNNSVRYIFKHCIGQRHKITTSKGKRSLKLKTMFVPEH